MRQIADVGWERSVRTGPMIALRIPGMWEGPDALALSLPDDVDLDDRGLHLPDGSVVEMTAIPPDDSFADIFLDSCDRPPSDEDAQAIAQYKVNVCLRGEGGSVEAARRMLRAAAAILHAGGAGVFVDNSGIAHGSEDWHALANDEGDGGAFWAYVMTIGDADTVWTIGMHVLGLRDAIMPRTGDDEFDHIRINDFLGYTYQSGEAIHDGDFIGDANGPEFSIHHEAVEDIPEDHPMYNPYGRWRLKPVVHA